MNEIYPLQASQLKYLKTELGADSGIQSRVLSAWVKASIYRNDFRSALYYICNDPHFVPFTPVFLNYSDKFIQIKAVQELQDLVEEFDPFDQMRLYSYQAEDGIRYFLKNLWIQQAIDEYQYIQPSEIKEQA